MLYIVDFGKVCEKRRFCLGGGTFFFYATAKLLPGNAGAKLRYAVCESAQPALTKAIVLRRRENNSRLAAS